MAVLVKVMFQSPKFISVHGIQQEIFEDFPTINGKANKSNQPENTETWKQWFDIIQLLEFYSQI